MEENELAKLKEAIDRTIGGDPDAYSLIVTSYMQKLYRTALSICKSSANAEDLVQETLIDGYLHLSDLKEPEKIESWLMRILKNKTLNVLTRTRRTEPEEKLSRLGVKNSPENVMCRSETMREWKERISNLSPALRETAMLYFWHEMTMEDISKELNIPLGTVKRRIHDAREKLRKEQDMTENKILPDSFAEAVAEKIKELESYTKTYGTVGFDSAYSNVKDLIANLSSKDDVKKYSLLGMEAAVRADLQKYGDDALAMFLKYNEPAKAAYLLIDLCWKFDSNEEKIKYTNETIFPELNKYPDSDEKAHAIAYHNFWMAHYIDKSSPEGIAEARRYLELAMEEYAKTELADASHGNTIAALKALDCLEEDRTMKELGVTGESWYLKDGNVYYSSQPGCNYASSSLSIFGFPIFYYAGCSGDGYFFPRTVELKAGASERMISDKGADEGVRLVVATDETVVTPAGTFENCLHIRKTENYNCSYDTWYKEGVGIVKASTPFRFGTMLLSSYEIAGGEGYLPIAKGNKWCYETPEKPDALYQRYEYVIERIGKCWNHNEYETVALSCLDYTALQKDWESTTDDPALRMMQISNLCDQKEFEAASDKLREIIIANNSRESVDVALYLLDNIEYKIEHNDWRFCPSSTNVSILTAEGDFISYLEADHTMNDIGPWGSRWEENRIFGVKPFRYLEQLCNTLYSEKWIPGYTEEHPHSWIDSTVKLSVDDGGVIETPAGKFENTVHLTIDCPVEGNPDAEDAYFYRHTYCGTKEYWFAPGVGVIRFKCAWGKQLESDAVLTEYNTVAANGEMMPIHIGNRWVYEEVNLTRENYVAKREYKVLSGMNGKYLLGDSQIFTWRGTEEEYEEFKKSLE